jgi:predicted ATP-binding protein involved in virulence
MKIRKLSVKNLFGIFNHVVPLNLDEHITIIHGPNGYGKTILLKILKSIFESNYSLLREIPFSEIMLEFDNEVQLRITKARDSRLRDFSHESRKDIKDFEPDLIYELKDDHKKLKKHIIEPIKFDSRKSFAFWTAIERNNPRIERINEDIWLDNDTGERFSYEKMLFSNKEKMFYNDINLKSMLKREEPEWLRDLISSLNIYFIEIHRLYSNTVNERGYLSRTLSVLNYSKELVSMMKTDLVKYGEISQSLDRTFPLRLVRMSNDMVFEPEILRNKFNEIEKRRSKLIDTGLLDKEEDLDLRELFSKIDASNKKVLSIYIDDVEKKLSVFDNLSKKIHIFQTIINNRFLYKKIIVSKKDGYIFQTSAGDEITPSVLSSGEQHELVMFFDLLFNVKPNSLILIDEPEISLHILWQQQFLRDLQEIAGIENYDVLIATHSPQIVYDRSDLTVSLEGPSNV